MEDNELMKRGDKDRGHEVSLGQSEFEKVATKTRRALPHARSVPGDSGKGQA